MLCVERNALHACVNVSMSNTECKQKRVNKKTPQSSFKLFCCQKN